jgi:hypothetical protein
MLWQQFGPLVRNGIEGRQQRQPRQPRQPTFNAVMIAEAEERARKAEAKAAAEAKAHTWKCARCVAVDRKSAESANDAITIFEGTAVCAVHL